MLKLILTLILVIIVLSVINLFTQLKYRLISLVLAVLCAILTILCFLAGNWLAIGLVMCATIWFVIYFKPLSEKTRETKENNQDEKKKG